MNKQELIGKYEGKQNKNLSFELLNAYIDFIRDLQQLDEPQKVVVPKCVADWIEECKNDDFHLFGAMEAISSNQKKLDYWFREDDNMELFARAWLDGYEVEKEKRYIVKMKGIDTNSAYLKHQLQNNHWYWGSLTECGAFSPYHTKKELEADDFGWVFDCDVVEVEEVTY